MRNPGENDLSHAWSQLDHRLIYKSENFKTFDDKQRTYRKGFYRVVRSLRVLKGNLAKLKNIIQSLDLTLLFMLIF